MKVGFYFHIRTLSDFEPLLGSFNGVFMDPVFKRHFKAAFETKPEKLRM
jgi:hypothetical protein